MKKTEIGGWYRLSLPSPDRLVIHVTNASVLHLQKWLASEIGQTEINFYLSMLSGFSFTMPEKGKPCGFNDALVPAKSDTGWSAWQFQLPVFPSGDEEWAMTPTQDGSIQSIALILTALSSYEAKAAAAEQLMLVTRVYIPNPSSSFGTNLVIGVCDRMIRLLQCRMVGEKCVELDRVKATVSACSEHMLPKRPRQDRGKMFRKRNLPYLDLGRHSEHDLGGVAGGHRANKRQGSPTS